MRLLTLILPFLTVARASPALERRQSVSTGAAVRIADITPYQDPARWAQAAYCQPPRGTTVNTATVLWTAGDGRAVPFAYVAYSQAKNTIVVAHQGTNTSSLSSILNDVRLVPVPPVADLSGCLPRGSLIHEGFQATWSATGPALLAQVRMAQQTYPSATVLLTGHSLGAAIAAIDSAYFACKGVQATTIVFGQPRTGNHNFAASLNLQHVNNYADPVPHLPPRSPVYWHSPGEVFISPANSDAFYAEPGAENVHGALSVEPTEYDVDDHSGIYAGVQINGRDGC